MEAVATCDTYWVTWSDPARHRYRRRSSSSSPVAGRVWCGQGSGLAVRSAEKSWFCCWRPPALVAADATHRRGTTAAVNRLRVGRAASEMGEDVILAGQESLGSTL